MGRPLTAHKQRRSHLHAVRANRTGRTRFRQNLREPPRRRLSRHGNARACRFHCRAGHRLSRHRVSGDGAPYIQHRGGPKGFIKVVDERTLGFADYRGNRQCITLANLPENDHAFLFLLDPAHHRRIKIWGRARMVETEAALTARLFDKGYKAKPERALLFTIEAWDVNCSQHIVTRFTEAELETAFNAVKAKMAELEAENARLHTALVERI